MPNSSKEIDHRKGKNLFKHGAYSISILLPGENQADYDALRKRLYEEWPPEGPSEEVKLESLLRWIWAQLRVLERLNQSLSNGEGEHQRDNGLEERTEALVSRIEAAKSDDEFEAALKSDHELTASIKIDMLPRELADVEVVKKKFVESLRKRLDEKTSSANGSGPEDLDSYMKLLERLEANISRQIKDLVQTKAMKQMIRSQHQNGRMGAPTVKSIEARAQS